MSYVVRTDKTWAQNIAELKRQFAMWGVTDWQIDPMPEGTRVADPAVARRVVLRFSQRGAEVVFVQEQQDRRVDNLRVVTLIVESMRLNEKRGLGDAMREAYLALPPPKEQGDGYTFKRPEDAYAVLGVAMNTPIEVAEAAYRTLARTAHPDAGGSNAAMAKLNEAIAVVRQRIGN